MSGTTPARALPLAPAGPMRAPVVPTAAVGAPDVDAGSQRRFSHRVVVLTVVAIAIGALAMGSSTVLAHDQSLAPATYLRYALVLTLGVYAVVGLLVATQITPTVRLRWTDGQPALGVAFGALVGGGLSVALLAAVSSAAGHLDPDPRIVTMLSEGDAAHVVATVLISCVAAPLIEEVLFRGLLLESQRWHGTRRAMWISAVAFAVWHLNPSALKYYALMGLLLGWLYLRHGLVCSIAGHAAFNGVLTVAALSIVVSPGPHLDVEGLTLQAPTGWHHPATTDGASLPSDATALDGPSGAALAVLALPTPVAPDMDRMLQALSAGSTGFGGSVDMHSVQQIDLHGVVALELDAHARSDSAKLVLVPHAGHSYELVLYSAGSPKAQRDFSRILESVRIG